MNTKRRIIGIFTLILAALCLIWPSASWAQMSDGASGGGGGGRTSVPVTPTVAPPSRLPIGSVAELWFEAFRFGGLLQFEIHSPTLVGECKKVYRFEPGTLTASKVEGLMRAVTTEFMVTDPKGTVTKLVSMQDIDGVWLLWGASHGTLVPSEGRAAYRFNGPKIALSLSPMARIYIPGAVAVEYVPAADGPPEESRFNLYVRNGEVSYPASLLERTGTILVTMSDGTQATYATTGERRVVAVSTANFEGYFGGAGMLHFTDVFDLDIHISANPRNIKGGGDPAWEAQMPAVEMTFTHTGRLQLQSRVTMPMEGGGTQYVPTIGYAARGKGNTDWKYFMANQYGRFVPVQVGERGEQVPIPAETPDFISVDAGVYEIIPIADPRWVVEPVSPWIDYGAKGSTP